MRPEMRQATCANGQVPWGAAACHGAMNLQTSKPFLHENAVVEVMSRDGHVRSWAEIKSEIFFKSIQGCDFNVTRACDGLGIGRSTLYRWLAGPAS